MTVILVILLFAVFITVDYFLSRRRATVDEVAIQTATANEIETIHVPASAGFDPVPVWVAGYQLPADRQYHPGHTWVRALNADTAEVGLDDFARRLVGSPRQMRLPQVGEKLRQGARAISMDVDGGDLRTVGLLSPLDGEVLEANTRLDEAPELAIEEPYGRGWLFRIRARNLSENLNNLMSGSLARRWTEDARERLDMELMSLSGSVMQDGGVPVDDFSRYINDEDWERLTREFLLT